MHISAQESVITIIMLIMFHCNQDIRCLEIKAMKGNGSFNSMDLLPPEVSSMKYCRLGVFRKDYFRLITE